MKHQRIASLLLLCGVLLLAACTIQPVQPVAEMDESMGEGMEMPIVDTHIHLWQLPRTEPPLSDDATFPTGCCGEIPWLEVDALMSDYNATPGGALIDHVVLVESSVATPPDKIIHSNQWMLDAVAADDKLMSVVGWLDVSQEPAAFAEQLDALGADKNFVGIRIGRGLFLPDTDATFENLQPNVIENLAAVAERGLMIDSLGASGTTVAEIAEAVPGLTIVMNHVAQKPLTLDVEDEWVADMEAAAAVDTIYIKVSDVHRLSTAAMEGAWPVQFPAETDPDAYTAVLETLWELFGEDRLIFGTNWPVSEVGGAEQDTIELQIQILESFLAGKGAEARNKIMHDNAMGVYGPRE